MRNLDMPTFSIDNGKGEGSEKDIRQEGKNVLSLRLGDMKTSNDCGFFE